LLEQPGIAQTVYSGWELSISSFVLALLREAIYTALGEEILFRGFIGSLLTRRLGFAQVLEFLFHPIVYEGLDLFTNFD
jgi:membrane protease YdiL (CAAX protease family)